MDVTVKAKLLAKIIVVSAILGWPAANLYADDSMDTGSSLIDRLKKKQSGSLEPNARKIALRRYGGHAKDKEKPDPEEANPDEYEIGIQSQTGTPGPIHVASEDFLKNKDEGGEKPSKTGPPNKRDLQGNFDPPKEAQVEAIIAPQLILCYPKSRPKPRNRSTEENPFPCPT